MTLEFDFNEAGVNKYDKIGPDRFTFSNMTRMQDFINVILDKAQSKSRLKITRVEDEIPQRTQANFEGCYVAQIEIT